VDTLHSIKKSAHPVVFTEVVAIFPTWFGSFDIGVQFVQAIFVFWIEIHY